MDRCLCMCLTAAVQVAEAARPTWRPSNANRQTTHSTKRVPECCCNFEIHIFWKLGFTNNSITTTTVTSPTSIKCIRIANRFRKETKTYTFEMHKYILVQGGSEATVGHRTDVGQIPTAWEQIFWLIIEISNFTRTFERVPASLKSKRVNTSLSTSFTYSTVRVRHV